jgi:membrane-associated phospholipid phosphatase
MAARNLAIMHLAIYDAVNALEMTHQPYLVSAQPQAGLSAEAAAAAAGHRTLSALYPRQRQRLDAILARCLAEVPATEESLDLGRFVADRVLEWRRRDGSDNPGRYEPRRGLGFWLPTPPDFQAPLLPEWGFVEPFAMRQGTPVRPPGPAPLSSPEYARAFNEVKALGGRQSSVRTDDQTQIAQFWADNLGTSTPPGHWNQIAQDVARQRGTTLAENARLFALLNVSLADAGIICWVIKFTYDYWRPITGIREADADGNPATAPDPDWMPLLDTPPFPSYTSGHSTFSSAGAAALASFFSSDAIAFTSTSEGLPGVRRSYSSFWAAAEEAGMSRIYGGIHWQFDNTDGLAMGRALGAYVARHYFLPRPARQRPPTISIERTPGP